MSHAKIDVSIGNDMGREDNRASLTAEVRGGNITTRGSGSANVTHYEVDLGGETVAGEWHDDARWPIGVTIDPSHRLAPAIRKIAYMQDRLRDLRSHSGKPTVGYTDQDWERMRSELSRLYRDAKEAVESDPICQSLLSAAVPA